ncbi:SDR family oxidoreductase [Brevibacterium aurantiacum]|uniref:SDR family oxidoreductase n=1 Tax=Brevibacterium aurantiacum TaxID=273384 RepID=UPI001865DDC2|nr:SDR family NAD(P)-dependent oxidoreductase [Brevibacterium aurantiacum]
MITGARGGIGLEVARSLDADGWSTVLIDVLPEPENLFERFTQPAVYVSVDITDEQAMSEIGPLVAQNREAFLAVAAAGVISVAKVEDLELAEWERVVAVNLTGTFLTLRSMIPAARRANTGRLIAVASDAAKTGEALLSHYSASKFGVLGLVQALALELVEDGITVNAICPSIVETPMMAQLAEQMSAVVGGSLAKWHESFVAEIPVGRACQPKDVTFMVRTLADPAADFITGQGINLAGGHEM